MNTIIMATLTISQSLGVNIVVTDVLRRSDQGSRVADDLSKGVVDTIWGFQGHHNRRMVAPDTLLDWIKYPTKDDMNLGYRILGEMKAKGIRGIVEPYRPPFMGHSQ